MDLRFGDHASFHRAAVGTVIGAAAAGLALYPVTPMAPLVGGMFGIAIGAAFGYGKTTWRLLAAAAASVPLFVMTPSWPVLALMACVLGLAVTLGSRGVRGAITVMIAATTTLLAMWTALRFDHARQVAAWPGWARDAAAAGAMGMVGVLAMLPRHLTIAIDRVQAAIRKLPADLDPEVRGLCDRSVAIWTATRGKLAEHDPGRELVRDGVCKILEVAAKSAELRAAGANDEELGKRMEDLDARIAAATDTEVKTQYEAARAALSDQKRYRDQIRQNRERLVARMHNHVAALEKFQLAAGGLAAAAHAGSIQQLTELSQDVAASGEALAEIEA